MRSPLAALALLASFVVSGAAAAQSRIAGRGGSEARDVKRGEPGPLKASFGIPVAQRLLQSDDVKARIRGIERLGAIGTTEAIDALVEALEQGSAAARDPRGKLEAVRVLAGHTKRDNARQILMREVTETTGSDGRGGVSPLAQVIRGTAALALARGGDKKSLAALVTALLQGGPASEAANKALRAYPPASLESLLEGRKPITPALAAFLGNLGDLRAIERLRALLQEPDPAGKVAAAVALAKLGDEAPALAQAREWLKKSEPRLRRTAAEVLVLLDAPEASSAVAALLESEVTRDEGLRLALIAPSPALAAGLARALPAFSEAARPRVIAALGRAHGIAELAALLDKPEHQTGAAFALAILPGDEARAALELALAGDKAKKGDARRLLLRAATVRALSLSDPPAGLRSALRALFKEKAPADRAVAAFGLVATGALSLDDAIEGACAAKAACDLDIIGAAARGALAMPDGASSLEPLLPLLRRAAEEADPRAAATGRLAGPGEALAIAVGAVLLAHPDGADLPTSVLATWAEAGGPLAPLAARALPSRDDDALRGRLKRLLEGTDPVVRAHVALGLARDPEPSSVTLLTHAYRFEEDAGVRRAIVRALSRRTEVQRVATLTLARDLDPDEEARSLARGALDGRVFDPGLTPALGVEPRRSLAWVAIEANSARSKDRPARLVRLGRADGLAIPAVADPDGVLMIPGLPPGPAALRVSTPR